MLRIPARPLFAVAALLAIAACQDAPDPTGVASSPRAAASPVAQDRLEAMFQRISPDVMALPGTVFSDNDESIGKVVIGVDNMGAARGVAQAMERLGVSDADYEVQLTQPIHFAASLQTSRFDTGVAGIQINFTQYVCSIGFNADKGTERSFITASHCTATQGGTEGTLYYQPSKSSFPTAIATEVDDPSYVKGGAGCPKGKKCRYSDASRALYASTYPSAKAIAITSGANNGSLTTTGTIAVTAQDDATTNFALGTVINKVGRTTGWTHGEVTRTCANTSVSGSTVYLFCQTFVSDPNGATVVSGGDSGSGVWTGSGSAKIVGILWGGSSDNKTFVFSPLAQVERELGALKAY